VAPRRKRKGGSGGSPVGWFLAGLALGAVGAVVLFSRGFIPGAPEPTPAEPRPAARAELELLDESDTGSEDPRYDFFTVLPEMEVVVPDRELSDQAAPEEPEAPAVAGDEAFVLQAGSFRSAGDADRMKARLALLGSVASIQEVTVNGETWHRVRVGPVQGARQANQLRRQLQDNGIDVLVLKVSG